MPSPSLPTIFEVCVPRPDVLHGRIHEADFAADLAQVLRDEGPLSYRNPVEFFANTHPTRGLRDLLRNICLRLSGSGEEASSIFRLDTQYGGGKTHSLIALAHAARGLGRGTVANIAEFIDPKLLPKSGKVQVAAFDGENADPTNGRPLGDGVRAHTPWGELAFLIGGQAGYDKLRKSDETHTAPGADTLRELFGGKPTLILLDELAVYLRKVRAVPAARDQLTAFLTALFKAVEGTPNAAVVFTLAIGKEGKTLDAYADENQFVADKLAEAESVSARKATILDPTAEDETAQVLRRRLFERIDDDKAATLVSAYQSLWQGHREGLPRARVHEDWAQALRLGYPLHPAVLDALTDKLSTLSNFQRVRGMLRLLARTVARLWQTRPPETYALHVHHIDPGYEPIRQELVTRLSLPSFDPPIRNDVAAAEEGRVSLAEQLDSQHHLGLVPYCSFIARTVLVHSLAFNDHLKGLSADELRFCILAPGVDPSFLESARRAFIEQSAYLDDRPGAPMRFLTEANLNQIIRRQEKDVDPSEARSYLNDTVLSIFKGPTLSLIPFPSGPGEVPDEVGDGKPLLAVIGYDAEAVRTEAVAIPELVERIYSHRGSAGTDFRRMPNNVMFLVADESSKDEMRQKATRRLALDALRSSTRLVDLAEHQQDKVQGLFNKSEHQLAIAIQRCYRHLFYPSRERVEGASVELGHTAIEIPATAERPGNGQQQVLRALRENKKLRMEDDAPDAPTFIRDRTPLRKGQISSASLREEFRRDPRLPILIGDSIFIKAIRSGIDQGEYVYQSGTLLYGKGDPPASIKIDEQSFVLTARYASEHGIWPRAATPSVTDAEATFRAAAKGASAGEAVERPGQPSGAPTRATAAGGAQAPHAVSTSFEAEGPLREALVRIFEKARAARVKALGSLTLQLFEASDAFRLVSAIEGVSGASKKASLDAGYTTADAELKLDYRGSLAELQPIRAFLQDQFRAAQATQLRAKFELSFTSGLSLEGDAAEKLSERLCKNASGAAFVEASALVAAVPAAPNEARR